MAYCYKLKIKGNEAKRVMKELTPLLADRFVLKYLIVYKKGEDKSYLFCNRRIYSPKGWWKKNTIPARIYTIDKIKANRDQYIFYGDKNLL